MAKLYFYYASMNAGKSSTLLAALKNVVRTEQGLGSAQCSLGFDQRRLVRHQAELPSLTRQIGGRDAEPDDPSRNTCCLNPRP